MTAFWKSFLRVVITVYLIFGLLLVIFQRDFLYHPTEDVTHDLEVEQYRNDDVTIELIVLNPGMPNAFLYFGGNAENVVYTAYEFKQHFDDTTVYLMQYRGYGGSEGEPSEEALYSDAELVYNNIHERHDELAVMGRSLGSGIAVYLAALKDIRRLMLVTPYDSIENIAAGFYPFYPVSLVLKDRYDSISKVADIKADILVLAAEFDQVIPRNSTMNLVETFPRARVTMLELKSVGHNNISVNREYYPSIKKFISQAESE